MKIYVDSDYRCHTANPDGTLREVETDLLDGKCSAYIEGCRYIPQKESWEREYGVVFTGEGISPVKNLSELNAAQAQYEADLAAAAAAYQEGVDSV